MTGGKDTSAQSQPCADADRGAGPAAMRPGYEGLLATVEAAAKGSRELDGHIAAAFGWHRVEPRFTSNRKGAWIAPEDFMGVESDGRPRLDSLHGTAFHRDPPCVSTNMGVALALVERAIPGACWRVEKLPPSGAEAYGRDFWATVGRPGEQEAATGRTAPVTILRALLRAKLAVDEARTEPVDRDSSREAKEAISPPPGHEGGE